MGGEAPPCIPAIYLSWLLVLAVGCTGSVDVPDAGSDAEIDAGDAGLGDADGGEADGGSGDDGGLDGGAGDGAGGDDGGGDGGDGGGAEIFEILFAHDFEDDPLGPYDYATWRADWREPAWSDPRPENWDSGAKLEIVSEGGNRFMRHLIESGDFSVGASLGFQWFTPIDGEHAELYLSFRMRASSLFAEQNLDGKLPGFINQRGDWSAGGRPGPDGGFATMMMFGNDLSSGGLGDGRYGSMYYTYHQEMPCNSYTQACCDLYPDECASWTLDCNDCPPEERVYWGQGGGIPCDFEPDVWYTFTQRLALNDPYTSNGLQEVFIDGQLVRTAGFYRFRDTDAVGISHILMHNFLGGSGEVPTGSGTWDFDDVVVFVYTDAAIVPRGTTPSEDGRTLELPVLR